MCGFVGFYSEKNYGNELESIMDSMLEQIKSRGPDSRGQWSDPQSGIHLGHQRLSILDLSPTGHQPMISISKRYVLSYNGEIYNHLELRKEIEENNSINWNGTSDTETLLMCIELYGVATTCTKIKGMFSFAVWDTKKQELYLARDRLGEKPLYYGWHNNNGNRIFLFGSDLRAFKPHPQYNPSVDRNSLSLLLRHNYIPSPYCIYKGFSKLEAGSIIKLFPKEDKIEYFKYWDVEKIAIEGKSNPFTGDYAESVRTTESLIKTSIKNQMLSDVPIGAFLSGGVDSSLIVALMQSESSMPVKTFTIGFEEKGFNEAKFAKEVALALSTDHTELYVTSKQSIDVIPKLPTLYGEPFADSSQIPTFLVSELAKKDVTVALSGDAGDELFCGYNRYNIADNFWKKISFIPLPLRKQLAIFLKSVPANLWNRASFLTNQLPSSPLSDKIVKGANVLNSKSVDDLYYKLISINSDPSSFLLNSHEQKSKITKDNTHLNILKSKEKMMLLDLISYLPDDILVKVDRASMGVSLETRVPLLDPKVVEFALRTPLDHKIKNGKSKAILKDILYKYVSKSLIERPKMGFGIPLDQWLRGPLRPWVEEMLNITRLKNEGFFNVEMVRSLWEDHLDGHKNSSAKLWGILMFQAWYEEQK
jgi:asparagine synthase (glutamine-hydrolysing)